MDDALFEQLRSEFSEEENYRARFNWAMGMGSQGFAKAQVCAVPEGAVAA